MGYKVETVVDVASPRCDVDVQICRFPFVELLVHSLYKRYDDVLGKTIVYAAENIKIVSLGEIDV
jgi:hypothetical protein